MRFDVPTRTENKLQVKQNLIYLLATMFVSDFLSPSVAAESKPNTCGQRRWSLFAETFLMGSKYLARWISKEANDTAASATLIAARSLTH